MVYQTNPSGYLTENLPSDTSALYRLYRSGMSHGSNACIMGRHSLQGAQQSETGECYKQSHMVS